jgi:hypothetical protein
MGGELWAVDGGLWGTVGDWGVSGPVLGGTAGPGIPEAQAPAMAGA